MSNYTAITAHELAELIFYEKVKEIGFIEDYPDDFEEGTEPDSYIYGIAVSHLFDDFTVVFGRYGYGIIDTFNGIDTVSDVLEVIKEFFYEEFHRSITPEREIFVWKEDLEKATK